MRPQLKRENGALAAGRDVKVSPYDDHVYHISMHRLLFDEKDVRDNGKICDHVLKHIHEHAAELRKLWEENQP